MGRGLGTHATHATIATPATMAQSSNLTSQNLALTTQRVTKNSARIFRRRHDGSLEQYAAREHEHFGDDAHAELVEQRRALDVVGVNGDGVDFEIARGRGDKANGIVARTRAPSRDDDDDGSFAAHAVARFQSTSSNHESLWVGRAFLPATCSATCSRMTWAILTRDLQGKTRATLASR